MLSSRLSSAARRASRPSAALVNSSRALSVNMRAKSISSQSPVSIARIQFQPKLAHIQIRSVNTSIQKLKKTNVDFSSCVTTSCVLKLSIKHFGEQKSFGTFYPDPAHPKGKHFEYITYNQFGEEVKKFARVLHRYNISKDSKVAIISNNRVEWAVAFYACHSLGAQLVPMYEVQPEKDWKYIIEDSGTSLVIAATEKIYDQVKGYIGTVGKVQGALCLDAGEDYIHSYKRWMKQAEKDLPDPSPVRVTGEDHAVLIYTSGTTGKPKGVILSHTNMVSNLEGIRTSWKHSLYQHNAICFLPWAHVFGQVADLQTMIGMGSSIAVIGQREHLMDAIPLVKPSILAAVPVLFNRIYDGIQKNMAGQSGLVRGLFKWALKVARKRNSLLEAHKPVPWFLNAKFELADKLVFAKIRDRLGGNLALMPSGGAGVPLTVLHFFEDIGIPITEGYGLTETSPVITVSAYGWDNRRLGCVGSSLHNLDVRVVDPETLATKPADTEGEVVVSGPSVMVGYHNNPAANAEVFVMHEGKRFFRTGDLGKFVEGKYLKITGRLKEQYKLENGKYVVPAPLEDDVCRSHFIAQALIFGDNKPFNISLVVIEPLEVKNWLTKQGVTVPENATLAELAKVDKVGELIAKELASVSSVMKSYERPARFALLDEGFSPENQLMTAKLSLRRKNIIAKYQDVIDGVYKGTAGYIVPRERDPSASDA